MTAILKMLLTKLWPAWIPFLLYFLWVFYKRIIRKDYSVKVFGKNFVWTLLSAVLFSIISFYFMIAEVRQYDDHYTPSRIENGVLLPSKTEKHQ